MFAAVTDHVFIDGGHTIDFTNKAFEALDHLGKDAASQVLPTLVLQTTAASAFRGVLGVASPARPRPPRERHVRADRRDRTAGRDRGGVDRRRCARRGSCSPTIRAPSPTRSCAAYEAGADDEAIGRAIAYAAALRIVRFHVQNDHGDWDTVHHSFTAANALHQALARNPTPELRRGCVHAALRVYLDRFLNVPAARLADGDHRQPRRARGVLRRAGHGRRGRQRGVRVLEGRRLTRGAGRRARPRVARRGRRVPLVPDGRGRRAPGECVARGLRGVGAGAGRRRPIPRRPHPDEKRAPDNDQNREPPAKRRSPLRRSRTRQGTPCERQGRLCRPRNPQPHARPGG